MSLDKKCLEFFSKYIKKHTGIYYPEKNYYQLESRITKMASFLEKSISETYSYFQQGPSDDHHIVFISLATNNETSFFRDKLVFDAITDTLIPKIQEELNPIELKIWCAACSAGQEPRSILMNMLENPKANQFSRFSIDCSDIDEDILKKSKSGVYSGLEVQRGLPIMLLTKYFDAHENAQDWIFKSQFNKHFNFFHFNLLSSPFPKNKYHLILCRNVLIYSLAPSETARRIF